MLAQSQIESPGVLFDAVTLTHMLQTLTPAQFRVWVAGQITDGSSSQVAQLLGLGVRQVQKNMKVFSGTANTTFVDEPGTANATFVDGPNAIGTRTHARATPLEVEYLSKKQKAEDALAGWAAKMHYQPPSEMPFMYQRLWAILNDRFGQAGPQVLVEILAFLEIPTPGPKKRLACYLAYIIGIARNWADDPTKREYSKAKTWKPTQTITVLEVPEYIETPFGRKRIR